MVKLSAEGPPLERLLRRIAETPRDFLADPAFGATGSVHTLAVVNDLLRMHGAQQVEPRLAELAKATPADANRLRLVQIYTVARPTYHAVSTTTLDPIVGR